MAKTYGNQLIPKDTEDREQDRKDFAARQAQLVETLRDVVHRTTRNGAVVILISVFHAQGAFGEFRRHTQQTRKDHPERSPWPTDAHGNSNACNVAKTNGARQSRGQRLEMAHLALRHWDPKSPL